MLVCLVRSFRQFLLSVSFTLFQDLPFSSHGSLIVFIPEEPWRKEEQIFFIRCGSEMMAIASGPSIMTPSRTACPPISTGFSGIDSA